MNRLSLLPLLVLSCAPLWAQGKDSPEVLLLRARVKHLEQRVSTLEERLAKLEGLVQAPSGKTPDDPAGQPGPAEDPAPKPEAGAVSLRPLAIARHGGGITDLRWEPQGGRLASGGYDNSLRVWEGRSGRQLKVLSQDSWVGRLEWEPGGKRLLASTMDGEVYVWDVARGKKLACRAFGKKGRSASGFGGAQWGREGSSVLYVLEHALHGASSKSLADTRVDGIPKGGLSLGDGYRDEINSFRWAPGRERVALITGASIRVWDSKLRGEQLRIDVGGEAVRGLAWGPKGDRLVALGSKGALHLWDVAGRRLLAERRALSVAAASFSPGGEWLAVGSGESVRLHDGDLGAARVTHAYGAKINALDWSSDGKALAVGGQGGKIVVLEVVK